MSSSSSLTCLALCWVAFFTSHSLLAGEVLVRTFGRRSRMAFNVIALAMLALPIAVLAYLPARPLWNEPQALRWALNIATVMALAGFVHTLKYYSLTGFLGLKTETWPLTFSPWHCWVRHPWYFLLLVLLWSRPLTDTWLVTATCATLYLVVGSRIEERRLLRHHPGSYLAYCRLVPGLLPWRGRAMDEPTRLSLEAQAAQEAN